MQCQGKYHYKSSIILEQISNIGNFSVAGSVKEHQRPARGGREAVPVSSGDV